MKKFILLISLTIALTGCKKCEYVCEEETLVTSIRIRSNDGKSFELPQSKDYINIHFDLAYDNRCKEWFQDNTDSCSTDCGSALIFSVISVSKFGKQSSKDYYEPLINGCKYLRDGPLFDIEEWGIKVLLERLEPYPSPGDTIDIEEYFATFKVFQTLEICKELK